MRVQINRAYWNLQQNFGWVPVEHHSYFARDRLDYRVTHTHLRDGFGIATAFAK